MLQIRGHISYSKMVLSNPLLVKSVLSGEKPSVLTVVGGITSPLAMDREKHIHVPASKN